MVTETTWENIHLLPSDLLILKKQLYDKCNFNCTNPVMETESTDYDACSFKIDDMFVVYRGAKITPTKVGQFVALWKRTD